MTPNKSGARDPKADVDGFESAPSDLESRIGTTFRQRALLEEALTHSSFANEGAALDGSLQSIQDNQRLEFLGDAILDFLVGEWLYERYRDADEGDLTAIRAHIVRTPGLARFAREIDLGDHLQLGKGEAASGGRRRSANLCAAFEALVGAMYLDAGFGGTRAWVRGFLSRHAHEIDAQRRTKDAKSLLQEHTQALLQVTPQYRIVSAVGPDHAKTFTAQVTVDGDVWGEGDGNSKQAAEQASAAAALGSRDIT